MNVYDPIQSLPALMYTDADFFLYSGYVTTR